MDRSALTARLARAVAAAPIALVIAGCHLLPWARPRPDPVESVSGPVPYVEDCQVCHAAPVAEHYAQSLHTAKGIRCGQCHTPGGHPDFALPVRDGKCGGCHQPQYQQTLASTHFATRHRLALDGDRAARTHLRRQGFIETTAGGRRFAGDSESGILGGRLCAACHYDEHRLGLEAVQQASACTGCHTGKEGHYPIPTPGLENRCIQCHVRRGATLNGQIVNTHRFAVPGAGGSGP
jgi:hypothetical protein